MKEHVVIRRVLGILFIIIGIFGIFFPILPGWLLIFVGLEIIGINLVFFDRIKSYAKSKLDKGRVKNDKSSN